MIRIAKTISVALLLAVIVSLGTWARGPAHACDQSAAAAAEAEADRAAAEAERMAAERAANGADEATEQRAPRARRGRPAPAPEAPTPPTPPSLLSPPAAPAAVSELEVPEAPSLILPRGWFGFGLQCEECTAKRGTEESPAVWRFHTLPRVYSVDQGGPAARAGIRRGDVLTHINGVSLLSAEGGRRFGATRPGERVRWTVSRNGGSRTVVARAEVRPERRERVQLRDLSKELSRLHEVADLDQLRRELAELNKQLEQRRLVETRVRAQTVSARRLRYAGVIGGTEVEVRGPGSVIVTEGDTKDELIINTGESVVLIRVPDSMRKSGDKPK